MNRMTKIPVLLCVYGLLLAPSPGMATGYNVTIDTTAIVGTSAQIAFDFIDGGPDSNSVTLSGFTTDGTLDAQTTIGSVIGALPGDVTLTDTDFFNELLADIALGTSISFLFTPTGNPPAAGSVPDAFSVFLLDPLSGLSLVATSDPTGADALLQLAIDGTNTGALSTYNLVGGDASWTVTPTLSPEPMPLPGTLVLLATGLLSFRHLKHHGRPGRVEHECQATVTKRPSVVNAPSSSEDCI